MQPLKAFISYSHQDTAMLDLLHKHLVQLQREGFIKTWEDREIQAGAKLDQQISKALGDSGLFLALLSPDYIASNYCYEREFEKALQLQDQGRLIIIPIIVEPCDWLHTPFNKFKALPKDGKAISTWENKNIAFLDVTQNIRRLVQTEKDLTEKIQPSANNVLRNYRVQKDFDSIDKLEFLEKTFHEIKEFLKRYIDEVIQLDNIKVKILQDDKKDFKAILVNRNKIATESQLNLTSGSENQMVGFFQADDKQIKYTIGMANANQKSFKVSFDDYHLFWVENNFFTARSNQVKFASKEIAETIWNEWLSSVGIQ